jgi:hypothetical protein
MGAERSAGVDAGVLRRAISGAELSNWLRDLDAGWLTLIVDACHSAATVATPGFKPGPMGSRGLGQLAYDKGMQILTSTQADDLALESGVIQQGLLSYALVHDGLEGAQADDAPADGRILLTEWLRFAEERVPQLYEEVRRGRIRAVRPTPDSRGVPLRLSGDERTLSGQRPSLFDFRRQAPEVRVWQATPRARPGSGSPSG